MRLGIYGGTFDPVHLGHLILAETCREACALDEVWFIPAAVSPHKQSRPVTPGKQRMEMLRFAIAGHPQFKLCSWELDRPGPSYTVDTLRHLKQEDPDRELCLLLGADALADFPKWREPQAILELAQLIAVSRGEQPADLDPITAAWGTQAADRVTCVQMPAIGISASDIRHRAATGRSIRFLAPRPVELFILQHQLYGPVGQEPA
jgi:nicotinate-nucleotide adenylyltransferase